MDVFLTYEVRDPVAILHMRKLSLRRVREISVVTAIVWVGVQC